MHLPIQLPPSSDVLVAGAGGGFDVVCALPVALALREAGHRPHLASFAGTQLEQLGPEVERPFAHLFRIDEKTQATPATQGYCPEIRLAHWWQQTFLEPCSVWSYQGIGVKPLYDIYSYLKERLHLRAIVTVDAGVDGLFHGDEFDDATPSIDAISIVAAYLHTDLLSTYAFTAFGTEGREYSVRHADALERMAELQRLQAFLGVSALTLNTSVGHHFRACVDSIHATMEPWTYSVMATSILGSMVGRFGETVLTPKTNTAPVWVSPLTSLYWFYDLAAVAQAKPILPDLKETETVVQVVDLFERYRDSHPTWPRRDIPI